LGHEDLAFQWLERAPAERDMQLLFLGTDLQFDVLRKASRWPEFENVLNRGRISPPVTHIK
jgi:hypothetical protein